MNVKSFIKVLTEKVKVDKIDLDEGNRMVRVGLGQYNHKWFLRFDVWFKGFQFTKR